MKGFLAWVKGHLIVVISVVIAVAALPALLFVSNGMNASLKEEVQDDVGDKMRGLSQISVQYSIEPLDPMIPVEGFSATPNAATTAALKAVIESHDRGATRVLEAAVARNRAGKRPMLDGLFPEPAPAETTAKRQSAAQAWLDAHRELLSRAGAGGPLSEDDLLVQLEAKESVETEKKLSTLGVSELPQEAADDVRSLLKAFRLDRLRERADDVTVFASMEIFEGVELPESTDLPTLEQIWDWQHRYWVHEDIVEAAADANINPSSGLPYRPAERPVKRLVTVETTAWVLGGAAGEDREQRSSRGRRGRQQSNEPVNSGVVPVGPLSAEVQPDFEASITGRAGWPYKANPLYDARYARVVAIVDGAGIDQFIESLEADNFMTVIDLDLYAVSPVEGLVEGYSYGAGGLLRAEMVVETLWLREWMGELAPDVVRERMGMPPRAAEEAFESDEFGESE